MRVEQNQSYRNVIDEVREPITFRIDAIGYLLQQVGAYYDYAKLNEQNNLIKKSGPNLTA